MMFVKQLI